MSAIRETDGLMILLLRAPGYVVPEGKIESVQIIGIDLDDEPEMTCLRLDMADEDEILIHIRDIEGVVEAEARRALI